MFIFDGKYSAPRIAHQFWGKKIQKFILVFFANKSTSAKVINQVIHFVCCHVKAVNRPISQMPKCTCSISHNASLKTEVCTFLFWMEHCGIGKFSSRKSSKETPHSSPVRGIMCEFKFWFTFCLGHCSEVCNIVWYRYYVIVALGCVLLPIWTNS